MTAHSNAFEEATYAKVARRLIPFLFLCYVVAFLDRVNIGFAKLQMAGDLRFSDEIYSLGAGIFFIGYFLFEVPSNVILEKVGARLWIARIMITWGLISTAFLLTGTLQWGSIATAFNCTDAEFTFYLLRFLLGVAEAGFFPGIILYLTYWFPARKRAKTVALFLTAVAISNAIGAPISGAIMQFMDGTASLRGWQWLFLLEGIPSVLLGLLVFVFLPNGPQSAHWLNEEERALIISRVALEQAAKPPARELVDAFRSPAVWLFATIYLCGVICLYAVNFWMPTLIQELGVSGSDFLTVGLLSMIPWGIAAYCMVRWAARSDRTGERQRHAACGLLIAVTGLLVMAIAGKSLWPAMAGLTLTTIGILCWLATFWALPTTILGGTAAAAGIAWINAVGNLGGHLGPTLMGSFRSAHHGDSTLAFCVMAALAMLGTILILLGPSAGRAEAQKHSGQPPVQPKERRLAPLNRGRYKPTRN